ncbi:MAG TPA: acetyl-CoA carboxylase, carboxyltransferase subunit beta [Limnochordia bacterium]|nr:acetyl-CoA carboxylase, carboxyltransferase subunit beta [Limnochordia bacterium]
MAKWRDLFGRPTKIRVPQQQSEQKERPDVPDGAWTKCEACGQLHYQKELAQNLFVCTKCRHHFVVGAWERIRQIADPGSFVERDAELDAGDPLQFPGYVEKRRQSEAKSGLKDAIVTGAAAVDGRRVALGVMDFHFIGGTLGQVVGERVVRLFEYATRERLPVILFSASGGARMQESILSLMQMQKTAAAVRLHSDAGLLYVSVLTHPTLAGVFGSFASLGDVIIAEPQAMVGFAGPRIIERTIRGQVPTDLQTAETVLANGFVDLILPRKELRGTLVRLLALHQAAPELESAHA